MWGPRPRVTEEGLKPRDSVLSPEVPQPSSEGLNLASLRPSARTLDLVAWTVHPALKTQGSLSPGRAPEAWQGGARGRGTHEAGVDPWLRTPAAPSRSHLNEEADGGTTATTESRTKGPQEEWSFYLLTQTRGPDALWGRTNIKWLWSGERFTAGRRKETGGPRREGPKLSDGFRQSTSKSQVRGSGCRVYDHLIHKSLVC